jgi:hypothetical protein
MHIIMIVQYIYIDILFYIVGHSAVGYFVPQRRWYIHFTAYSVVGSALWASATCFMGIRNLGVDKRNVPQSAFGAPIYNFMNCYL